MTQTSDRTASRRQFARVHSYNKAQQQPQKQRASRQAGRQAGRAGAQVNSGDRNQCDLRCGHGASRDETHTESRERENNALPGMLPTLL